MRIASLWVVPRDVGGLVPFAMIVSLLFSQFHEFALINRL
jgi:hypothetical protein